MIIKTRNAMGTFFSFRTSIGRFATETLVQRVFGERESDG